MARRKTKDFVFPEVQVNITPIGKWFRLEIDGKLVPEEAFHADSEVAAKKFTRIYAEQIKAFAYYRPDHSILTEVAGRKGDNQRHEIRQWSKEGLYLA